MSLYSFALTLRKNLSDFKLEFLILLPEKDKCNHVNAVQKLYAGARISYG